MLLVYLDLLCFLQCDPEEDENIKTLKGIEEDLLKQEKHLSDLTYELDGVQQVIGQA